MVAAKNKSSAERLGEIARELGGWVDIDTLTDAAISDSEFNFEEGPIARAARGEMKSQVRRLIKKLRGADGVPDFASIIRKNEDGDKVRVYKQETLFDMNDYRQTINYWHQAKKYAGKMEHGYRKRCRERFGMDPELPFEESRDEL